MDLMDWYLEALRHSGVNVVVLDTWWVPDSSYKWRTGQPEGAMWHHTATTAYTPNDEKANQWAGIMRGDRLYQDGDGEPTLVLANQYPARISSGYGVKALFDDYVCQDRRFVGRQTAPDDDWAGNRSYWNTEIVLDGVGGVMRGDVWDMCVTAAAVLSEGMGWSAWRNVGHLHHTGRKIDLRDGRYPDGVATMEAFQDQIQLAMESDDMMDLERYATRWRNPQDFDAAAIKGLITEAEAEYWKTVPTDSEEWADLRDAIEVRFKLW